MDREALFKICVEAYPASPIPAQPRSQFAEFCASKWVAFGKTGTAQIPNPIPGQHGYADGAFTGTFVGGAPASDPQLVCLVSIHWPKVGSHFGAVVAAPYWKDVMEKSLTYLNVQPDKEPEPTKADPHARAGHGD